MKKYTITNFNRDFPDDSACLAWLVDYLYLDGITCKKCEAITKHHRVKSRLSYSCDACGNHVHPMAGTIFEKSTTSLKLWFYAIYLMAQTRSGISAKQLERELGVTYKCAWRIFKQIRLMLSQLDSEPLSGEIEIDETYIGGKGKNRAFIRTKEKPKEVVMGVVESNGSVRLTHIPNSGKWTLLKQIQKQVKEGSHIYTDQWRAYSSLNKRGYDHDVVDHGKTFVTGKAHTQNLENMWSHLKRGIYCVYRKVGPKYLQSYADEYAFRYSHRNDEMPMFFILLSSVRKH